jgi:phage terminase small subunit
MTLTPKQTRFVDEYLRDLNATQAAVRAGYSPSSAAEIGYENLRKPQIARAISEAFKARGERTRVSQDQVVREIAKSGFATILDVAEWTTDGVRFKGSDEIPPEAAGAIKSVKSVTTTLEDGTIRVTREIVLHDKIRALELLGRHLGIFTDKVQMVPPTDGFTIRLIGLPEKPRGPAPA